MKTENRGIKLKSSEHSLCVMSIIRIIFFSAKAKCLYQMNGENKFED